MTEHDGILVSEQVLQVPFNYSAGPMASRFLVALRDEKKILGIKCGSCKRVYMPPRAFCGSCQERLGEWVEIGPCGVVTNYTDVHYHESVHPLPAAFTIGLIKLEGADTALLHAIAADGADIHEGMEVEPVWAENRRGHILDIKFFRPAG